VTTFGRCGHPVAQAPLGRATQGADDRNVPRSVGEHYGRTIPGAVLTLCEREGHFVFYSHAAGILGALASAETPDPEDDARQPDARHPDIGGVTTGR
jgi:hypothetical protein